MSWRKSIQNIDTIPSDSMPWKNTIASMTDLQSNDGITTGEGLLLGAQKGSTFGFNDELAALAGTLGAKSEGDTRNFWDIYNEIKPQIQSEQTNIEEQAPISTGIGELAGGLLIPGAVFNKVGSIGKGLSNAGSFANLAREGALIGTAGGALTAAGTSDAGLTSNEPNQLGQFTSDIIQGAGTGAIIGTALPSIGSAIKGIFGYTGKKIAGTQLAKDIKDTFSFTLKGKDLSNLNKLSDETRTQIENIQNQFQDLHNLTREANFGSKADIDKLGTEINVKDAYNKLSSEIDTLQPNTDTEIKYLNDLKKSLNNMVRKSEETTTSYGQVSKIPSKKNEEKALDNILKKTAEEETSRTLQLKELYKKLENTTDDEKTTANIVAKIRKLEKAEAVSPGLTVEPKTQLPVAFVERGEKAPIVEGISQSTPPISLAKDVRTSEILGKENATPSQLENIATSIKKNQIVNYPLKDTEVYKTSENILNTLKSLRDQGIESTLEGKHLQEKAAQATAQFKSNKQAQELLDLPKYLSSIPKEKSTEIEKALNKIKDISLSGSSASGDIQEAISLIENTSPELAKQLTELPNISRQLKLSSKLNKSSALTPSISNLGMGLHAMPLQAAQIAADITKGIKTVAETGQNVLANISRKVIDSDPTQISQLLAKTAAKGTETSVKAAQALQHVLSKPENRQKAYLFTLMQQPWFRSAINDSKGE